jgi:hypothetical protein
MHRFDTIPIHDLHPRYNMYKAKQGVTDRCHIVYTDAAHIVTAAKVHFKNKFFLCKSGPNQEICCQVLGPARWRVTTVLVKYKTSIEGIITSPLKYDLYPWIFGEATYLKLIDFQRSHSLETPDFTIDCLREEFQQVTLNPCSLSLWTDDLNSAHRIEIEAISQHGKACLGLDLSIEEINNLLEAPSRDDENIQTHRQDPVAENRAQVQTQAPWGSKSSVIVPQITIISGKRKILMD